MLIRNVTGTDVSGTGDSHVKTMDIMGNPYGRSSKSELGRREATTDILSAFGPSN
jgi:hypothetical protein